MRYTRLFYDYIGGYMGDLVSQKNEDAILGMIERVATDKNSDVSKMEKILDMQERIYNKNCEIEFNKSMVECQKEMPLVVAKSVNMQTGSCYAKYEHLITDIKPTYTKHGFSLSFGELDCDKDYFVKMGCEVMHMNGHSKKYNVTLPIDNAGIEGSVNKTQIHGIASTYSYAKRYLATQVFNIAIADHDDDAVLAGGLTIQKLLDYNSLLKELWPTVSSVKENIMNENLNIAAEAWHELSLDEKRAICLAPTKGGIFTTEERNILLKNSLFGSSAP